MRRKSRKEGKAASQRGMEGRPVSTEPVGTRPRIRLPEPLDPAPHFQVPVPSWERGLPCFGPALPAQRKERRRRRGEGKESALLSMLPYQLDIDNTTPSVIDIVLGPIYYTVPMHGDDISM